MKVREDGYKEVPNLTLTLIKGLEVRSFDLLSVKDYFEEYDSEYGPEVSFTTGLMAPECYNALTGQSYDLYVLEKEMMWRNAEDGTDYETSAPAQTFKYLSLAHMVDYEGDPADWEFCLRN